MLRAVVWNTVKLVVDRRVVSRAMASSSSSFQFADRLKGFETPTVWHEFTPLAQQLNACNLGQGFPDWACPDFMKAALKKAVDADFNQYTRSGGHMRLVQELAKRYSKVLQREVDPLTQVAACVGATEALFAVCQALLNPGDEVIIFEPAFDIYSAQVQMAGGVCKYIPLMPVPNAEKGFDWTFDRAQLAAAFTPKTRMIITNNPHNPTGKLYTREEQLFIAEEVLKRPNVFVASDEVYDELTYDAEFVRMASLPGMWERTISVASAGKMFSVTGWKIGWVVGPADLVKPIMLANQWVQFSVATTLQEAVADALVAAEQPYKGAANYYEWLRASYRGKRDRLMAILTEAGFKPSLPDGGFFIMADTSAFTVPDKFLNETTAAAPVMTRDWAFCRMLTMEVGVAAIPPSAFYSPPNKGVAANFARFAFCKGDDTLEKAAVCFKEKLPKSK